MKALSRIISQPWAITPASLNVILNIANRNNVPEAITLSKGNKEQGSITSIKNGVAVIPIMGPIFPRASIFNSISGATSVDILAKELKQSVENDEVKSIILDIDSPGGAVTGIAEFSQMIFDARGKKPITAVVDGMAASAAYWIASAADSVVLSKTSGVGSIGVVTAGYKQIEADHNGFMEYEIVSSNAENKRVDPSTEEGQSVIRETLDEIESSFVADVARNRNVGIEKVLSDFGRGGLLIGQKALKAGMVDKIDTFESTLISVGGGSQLPLFSANLQQTEEKSMSEENKKDANTIKAENDAAKASVDAMVAEAKEKGANEERARISAIRDITMAGYEDMASKAIDDGKTTAAELSVQILKAQKEKGSSFMSNLEKDEKDKPEINPDIEQTEEEEDVSEDGDDTLDAEANATWKKDKKLRSSFTSKKSFVAYYKANKKGYVRAFKEEK